MTFSDPATSVPFSTQDASPFLDQPDGSTEQTGDGQGYDPTLPEVSELGTLPVWLEGDPEFQEPKPGDGVTEDDSAPNSQDDLLTGCPGPEENTWIDPLPDAWICDFPGPDGVTFWEEQDPESENVPPWRGGDAPLPWWRGASAGEDGAEPLMYALDGVVDPGLDPEIQICYFSLGAPAAVAVDGDAEPTRGSVAAGALSPADASDLPQPAEPPAALEPAAAADPAVAEEGAPDSLDALLALTQSGTTGVQASAAWRELILQA